MARKQPLRPEKHNPLNLRKIERIVQAEKKFHRPITEVKHK